MKRFLQLISLVFLSLLPISAHGQIFPNKDGERCEYNTEISFKGTQLTGICVLKKVDGQLIGTIINEFGIKAFDLIVEMNSHKVKLKNVISFLDKWYIRRVIKKDLKDLFAHIYTHAALSKNKSISITENSVMLKNSKRDITYTFHIIN